MIGEIDISPYVQIAALVGLGLVHCCSINRLIIEFLLTELSSPSNLQSNQGGPDGHPHQDTTDAIALSAGWALGMLLLGVGRVRMSETLGNSNFDIHDLRIEDRLQQCIDGGMKVQQSHFFQVPFMI